MCFIQSATIFFRASSLFSNFIAMVKYMRANNTVVVAHGNFYLFSYHLPCLFFHHRFENNYFSIFIFIISPPPSFVVVSATHLHTNTDTILLNLIYFQFSHNIIVKILIGTTILIKFFFFIFLATNKIHQISE